MLQIPCPWCGPRDEIEFAPRGPVSSRPDPSTASDLEWTTYLHQGDNTRGWLREYWVHLHGCGQLFIVRRQTLTNEVAPEEGS
jgi:heterotetrameric sarcosine oxidase delta subunit